MADKRKPKKKSQQKPAQPAVEDVATGKPRADGASARKMPVQSPAKQNPAPARPEAETTGSSPSGKPKKQKSKKRR